MALYVKANEMEKDAIKNWYQSKRFDMHITETSYVWFLKSLIVLNKPFFFLVKSLPIIELS